MTTLQAMCACIYEIGADFSRGCMVERIGHLLFATHPHHGLPYIYLGFLTQMLLRSFTATPICGMNRGNRCPYPPFPFPTYYPDTGTGSDDANRTLVEPLAQPLSKQTSQRLTLLHTLSPRQNHICHSSSPTRFHIGRSNHCQRRTQT
jgi:hypothetical protein